jgi:hypothetical protein
MPILATQGFWNVDSLNVKRGIGMWTQTETDRRIVRDRILLKDKKQSGTQRGNRSGCVVLWVYQCGKINFDECHR